MPKSKAAIAANNRWEAKAYDKVLLRLPKGTKSRIQAQAESVNGYISAALMKQLQKDEQTTKKPPT